MIRSSLIILAILTLCIAASAQNRVFDNFDRSQGVSVQLPPQPALPPVTRRVKRNGRWMAVTEDSRVKKTASSRPTQSVADGFANRERGYNPNGTRLSMGSSSHLKGFTTGIPAHDLYIVDSSRKYRIDPLLIYAQMHQESAFKIRATSHKGASGLMQLMPATARRFGVTKIYDPQQNIDAGVKYMRWLLDTFNQDVALALAGYNAGEGAVMKYGWRVPPYRETQEYVRRISARYGMISDGRYVNAPRNTNENIAKVIQKDAAPLTALEISPVALRTSDGKMILVNQ